MDNGYNDPSDVTNCQVCGRSDREDRMLLCDRCDDGYHCECLSPPLNEIPEGEWFCEVCQEADDLRRETQPTTSRLRQTRSIAR